MLDRIHVETKREGRACRVRSPRITGSRMVRSDSRNRLICSEQIKLPRDIAPQALVMSEGFTVGGVGSGILYPLVRGP